MPHAHNVVHIDRKGVHGSLPPPRHMEGLRWQRKPSSSGKHLKEDGIKKVADEGPGGSNTGFIRPLPGRRITLLWLCTFCLVDYKGKKPRGSRCKITGACLNGPRAFRQFKGCCGKSEAMPAADSLNGCRTLQQVSHSGVTTLRMWGSKGTSSKRRVPAGKRMLPSGLLPWGGFRRGWKWARR